MKFVFLGTGTSVGVPQIGCDCRVCTSKDPRDKRRRCGAYVVCADGTSFLIDTPPEMREACLAAGVTRADAIVLTHAHMDHIAGFDDVRRFNTIKGKETGEKGAVLPCWAPEPTIAQMHVIFPYIGLQGGEKGLYRPQIDFRPASEPFSIGSVRLEAFEVEHGFPCCGYVMEEAGRRIGYVSDCHDIGESALELLHGVDVMVIGCLREREHPTHLSLERAKEYLAKIAPKRAFSTHMCHDLTHEEWIERFSGTNCSPAYDTLTLEV